MREIHVYDMIVVGGGPGGYTAALYAARAGLDTLVLEKLSAGGQMALTEKIDNYPGFEDGIDGFTLAEKMQRQAERFGAKSEYAQVERMDLTATPKILETSEGTFFGRTVVLATGANPRELGLPNEAALTGRGVAYCAACDGMRYKGGGRGRRQLGRCGRHAAQPHRAKGDPGPPPGHPAGHQGLSPAADGGGKHRIPLEQHRHRAAPRQ